MHVSFERTAQEAPLGTVLLAHGYAEHSGRYAHLRCALTRAGYDVAYYDHAGHGTSEGPRARVDVGALIRDFGDARPRPRGRGARRTSRGPRRRSRRRRSRRG